MALTQAEKDELEKLKKRSASLEQEAEDAPGTLGLLGQTASNMFVKPLTNLGESIGSFSGKQKYGTGISADGDATGHPIERGTLLGDLATLPGTALNVAGIGLDVNDAVGGAVASGAKKTAEYVTGQDFSSPGVAPAAPAAPVAQAGDALAGTQAPQLSSPQDIFNAASAKGALTPEFTQFANQKATEMGTTFDPTTGFDRQPFLDSQNQAPTQAPTIGLETDAQGRMIAPGQDRDFFDGQSADREQRISDNFGRARGPDSRDRDDGQLRDSDFRDIAKGSVRGASASDVARASKVSARSAESQVSEQESLRMEGQRKRNEILDQQIAAGQNPQASPADKKLSEQSSLWKAGQADGTLEEWEVDAQKKDFYKKPAPVGYKSWVEYEAENRGKSGEEAAVADSAETSTQTGGVPVVESEADYNDLSSGDKFMSGGKEYTKE